MASKTPPPPPEEQPTTVQQPAAAYTVNVSDIARMPIPGNAEFLVYVLALIVDWLTFFTFTTVAYLLSRGVAKASRVLEQ
jgi:hypothetical protein